LAISSIIAVSCDSDDDVPYTVGNSLALLEEDQISFFDINELITFNISELSASTALTGLEVLIDDVKIADGTIVDEVTATISSSSLLPFEFEGADGEITNTGTFDLLVLSTEANGEVGRNELSLDVVKPLSFSNEINSVVYGDVTTENSEVGFETFTSGAVIDEVIVSWRKGIEGTYVEDTAKSFNVAGDFLDLNDLDYIDYGLAVNDTLYYQFTATSGVLVDTVETSVVLLPQVFNNEVSVNLSNTALNVEYNLTTGEEITELSEVLGELAFFENQGFSTLEGISFVKLADAGTDFFEAYTNVDSAKADFEVGVALTSTQVETGDIYVYEAVRDSVTYYGAILVGDVVNVNSGESISFDLTVKENIAIEVLN